MPRYQYQAAQADGTLLTGSLAADNTQAARLQLHERGLCTLSLQLINEQPSNSWLNPGIKATDLCWLTRELASLLSARLPLEAALSACLEQTHKKNLLQAISAVREDVRSGMRLADAMAERPRDFPDIYRALISAGEDAGDLGRVMERLADYLENRDNLKNQLITAFIYPIVVAVVAVAIVIFLLSYVVPQVISAFTQTRQELPAITQVMIYSSDFIRDWGWLCGLSIATAALLARFALQNPARRLRWHSVCLTLPLVGNYLLGVNTARFAATLAILMDAGVPLLRALAAAHDTLANVRLKHSLQEAAARTREGAPLALALREQKIFPPNLIHLVASGEHTGTLAHMLDRAAQNLSRDLERRATRLSALLEPLMILAMGGVVMLIVLAVLMPIMEINQMVQ